MSVGASLRSAVRDFYQQSWRLLVLNAALSTFVLAVVGIGLWFAPALALLVLVGPWQGPRLPSCCSRSTSSGWRRLWSRS
jgi:hypothetical protein